MCLPTGYEQGRTRYPVLFLLHGGGGDETTWTGGSHAQDILGNLLAAGQARPMLVVMPNAGGQVDRPAAGTHPVGSPPGNFFVVAAAMPRFRFRVHADADADMADCLAGARGCYM